MSVHSLVAILAFALRDGSIRYEERVFLPFVYADSKIVVRGFPVVSGEEK